MKVNGYEIKPGANLKDANLEGANLKGAKLRYAILKGTILEKEEEHHQINEGVDPWNLSGRDPTQSVWKNGKRPSPDYYEIINGKMND